MLTFIFHSDPGHGWLEVKEDIVRALKVRVSQFSYRNGGKLFLEEDCDAPRFIDALKANGIEYKIVSNNCNHESPIRSYDRV